MVETFALREEAKQRDLFIRLDLGDRYQVMPQFRPNYLLRSKQAPIPHFVAVVLARGEPQVRMLVPCGPGAFDGSRHCLVTFHLSSPVSRGQPAWWHQ